MWEKINNFAFRLYHKLRKKSFGTFSKENLEKIKIVPCGAIGSVFGGNVLTNIFNELRTEQENMPTHTFLYLGEGEHNIVEADIFFSKNRLERYTESKVVIHYFRNLTSDNIQEIKRRVYYLLSKKLLYDYGGYTGFITRRISLLEKIRILSASNTRVFCSDGTIVVYHGDEFNTDEEIKSWDIISLISLIKIANHNCPADIYVYLHRLYELYPNIVGEVIIEPVR